MWALISSQSFGQVAAPSPISTWCCSWADCAWFCRDWPFSAEFTELTLEQASNTTGMMLAPIHRQITCSALEHACLLSATLHSTCGRRTIGGWGRGEGGEWSNETGEGSDMRKRRVPGSGIRGVDRRIRRLESSRRKTLLQIALTMSLTAVSWQ